MLTPKMHKIADDIGSFIVNCYDEEYLDWPFSCGLVIEDIIFQVLILCCRYAYLVNAEKHPISYYIKQDDLEYDLARKEHERIIKYILEKENLANERMKQNIGDSFNSPDISLVKKGNRYPEYSFSKFQYWESKNIHDMELVKSVVERRISSSKKVPNSRFIAIAEEYDSAVALMKEEFGKSPERTVYSSIQFFTLQQRYSFDYFYEIADAMENLGIKSFPDMKDRLMTVSGQYKSVSSLPELYPNYAADSDRKIEYQLILQRRRIIPQMLSNNDYVSIIFGAFIEGNTLVNAIRSHMSLGGKPLPQIIAEETTIEDWASVFEIYDVFSTFVPYKNWTDSKIQVVRKIYDLLSLDYKSLKHPENRP